MIPKHFFEYGQTFFDVFGFQPPQDRRGADVFLLGKTLGEQKKILLPDNPVIHHNRFWTAPALMALDKHADVIR